MVSDPRQTRRLDHRRGVTLVEIMALLIVVAVAVPPIAALSASSSRALVEERRSFHTAWLATAVLEQIIADASSGEEPMSLDAMGDQAYLDDGATGLRARLASITDSYENDGMTYEVTFGLVRDAEGNAIDADDRAATRVVTVEILYTNELGRAVRAPFTTVVGAP